MKLKGKIRKITKDDSAKYCDVRVIIAEVTTSKGAFEVLWADTPVNIGIDEEECRENAEKFQSAWMCEKGDFVVLYHNKATGFNYFVPKVLL